MDGSTDKQFIWTLLLRQNIELDMLALLCSHLNVAGDPDLVDTDQYKLKKYKDRQHWFNFWPQKLAVNNQGVNYW